MTISIEQQIEFSTNWKKYQENGLHKPKPYVIETGLPESSPYWFKPQIHKKSDLTRRYHILYNYLRGLPLTRGLSGTEKDVKELLSDIYNYDYWEYNNRAYHLAYFTSKDDAANANKQKNRLNTLLKKHQEIFGNNLTIEILGDFIMELHSITR